ncbi:protein translocase subunit SecF [Gudongella oleilytica]|jgi:preprotein translocase SecF subunit|uniref:protein translocase subunit SecF n=1 Tax=Gudongella oleilytica TaxID=1582259 RepID=UPI002A370E02|nr:protein translocase subunit SecF [Gudongella oleilytica]MDY0256924.1 protein translocase subunit SecF [Gudongella oleilytica]
MNVIKNYKLFYAISLAVIAVGLIMFAVNGLNYGIDFTGGTMLQLEVGKFVSVEQAREIVSVYDENASIIHSGPEKAELIIRSSKDLSNKDTTEIVSQFVEVYGMDGSNFQTQKFGPFMGKEIRDRAIFSVIIASVLMLAYISFRFQFKFGVAAVIALVHDVLVTFAVYSVLRLPVNSSFIAAILTIVGYSINDTIVIFDRIREESKIYPKLGFGEVINNSINLSLRRTLFTTLTTLMAVTILYIVGVEDVKVLALPLIIGMLSGTYSSLFIATPILYSLKRLKTNG